MEAKLEKAEAAAESSLEPRSSRYGSKERTRSCGEGDLATCSTMSGKADPAVNVHGSTTKVAGQDIKPLNKHDETRERREHDEKTRPDRRAKVEDVSDPSPDPDAYPAANQNSMPPEATRYERARKRHETTGLDTRASDLPQRQKPKTLDDLTADQKERYLKAKAAKGKGREVTDSGGLERAGAVSEDKVQMGQRGEAVLRGAGESQSSRDKGRSQRVDQPKKRLEDLTEEEKDKYMRARAERKAKERAKLKLGQGSGLSAEEKEAIASP
jgi:hypothetical protein